MNPLRNRIRVLPGRRRMATPLRIRGGVYLLPNLVTSGGLFCGFYSVISTIRENYLLAATAVLVAQIFDALDGRVARMTKTSSHFGVEYDSLSDLVAFGVAPGVLAYRWALEPWGPWGWLAASLYVICGALRLARFNVQVEVVDKHSFVGLPIPAAAAVVATTILMYYFLGGEGATNKHITLLLLVYALAALMISTIPYYSFKELHLRHREPFWILFLGIVVMSLAIAEPQVTLFSIFSLYALSGPARALGRLWHKAPSRDLTPELRTTPRQPPRPLDSNEESSL
ncbi:MAG TPA: CDP-diacylglycerol--serine O-phosphatidyltransferase [Candidatus Binatia bacterium]|nr:CDP-diacylglycerol--serine O-phosphatidyltransferase [Candidatus Binatia bacterium]